LDALAGKLGQYDARRIFTKYAKPITKREAQLNSAAMDLWRHITMKPKRNLTKLARQLAREDGIDEGAIAQRLWRALNPKTAYGKRVREYLREELFERGINIRTIDKSGKTQDTLVSDMLDAGLSLGDLLSEIENSLHDIFFNFVMA
jgi:hypothetical protein